MYTPTDLATLLKTDVATINRMKVERLMPRPAIENGYVTRWDVRSINHWIGYHSLTQPVFQGQTVLEDSQQIIEPCPGNRIRFSDFYERYLKLVTLANREPMTNKFVIGALREQYPVGLGPGKVNYIGNVRFRGDEYAGTSTPFILSKGRLKRENHSSQ